MKLNEILTLDCTHCAVPVTSKKNILEQISAIAAEKISEHSQFELLDSLMEREKMGSTGIGKGIAIPHGRLSNAEKVLAVIFTAQEPIDFDAIDNREVDIFIALFVPESCCQEHLTTLQSIAKLFSNKDFCKQVRKANSNIELFTLITSASEAA